MNYRKAIWLLCIVLTIQSVLYGQNNQWTWMKGDITPNFAGVYGTKGVPATNNKPGSRESAVSWADLNGNIWLFGGYGKSTTTLSGNLNDLWKFDTISKMWTWVKGNNTLNSFGVYGTKGTAAPGNQPGSRSNSNSWTDQSGNLWLFGGIGNGNSANGSLNDLWKFDTLIKQWTWVNGDSIPDVTGVYGTQGIGANGNKPGGRNGSISCFDNAGNFWLFGGIGYGSISSGALNDLWKYNAVSNVWTWIKGDNAVDIAGVYGTKGVPNSNNKPGSRESANAWTDQNGNFWLFGGYGNNSGSTSYLNDLWKFDTTTKMWTWITGENSLDNGGVYGTQGVSSFQNTPGSRSGASNWKDGLGNFWLFGGNGYDGVFSSGFLNDLWKYNISTNQWTWIKGDINSNNVGVYGTQGSSAPGNKPGSRAASVGSTNVNGDFWLFGQFGYGSTSATGSLNDLWKFKPCSAVINLISNTGNFCSSGSVLLTASGGMIYEWYKDGVLISGASGNNYSATLPGSYHAKSNIGSCLDVYSNEVILAPGSIPPDLGGTGVYCLGDNVSVGIPVTQLIQSYSWARNGTRVYGPIGGNGGNQSLNFSVNANNAGIYIVESTKPDCDTVYSNYVYVGFAAITNLVITNLCTNTVSFNWDNVVPPLVSQKYEYAVSQSPVPPINGIETAVANGSGSSLSPGTLYYIHARVACGFGLSNFGEWTSFSFTTESTPLPAGTCEWTGAESTAWFNSANWKCGQLPVTTSEVIINGNRLNYPAVNVDITIKKLTVKAGASINVAPNVNLIITGQ